jgi:dTDP-4-dehydrorhamnose 3,5-epimerase
MKKELRFERFEKLPEVFLIKPPMFGDERGYFLETYHAEKYRDGGIPETFVQDNQSFSLHGVLRGMHAQLRQPQGKLVRAITGSIFDAVVDIRPGSPTFGTWVGETLSDENQWQLYVPPGFAHGFCVLSESTCVQYKCTDYYAPGDEFGLRFNDPEVGIAWPLPDSELVLNPRDAAAPLLSELAAGRLEPYRALVR